MVDGISDQRSLPCIFFLLKDRKDRFLTGKTIQDLKEKIFTVHFQHEITDLGSYQKMKGFQVIKSMIPGRPGMSQGRNMDLASHDKTLDKIGLESQGLSGGSLLQNPAEQ